MKISLSNDQIQKHTAASRRGAIEGAVVGSSVGLATSYWAQRNLHAYQRLPLSLKALGIIIVTAPCLSIQAERRGLEYDRSQWEGAAVHVLDERELQAEKHWESLSFWDKVGDWSFRHQYSLIMGGWASSLGVAAAIISRNKYQTYPQKIVQARMWAQGLTVGLLIVAGALTHSKRELAHHEVDHSWRDILEQQERDRKEHAAIATHVAPVAAHSPAH